MVPWLISCRVVSNGDPRLFVAYDLTYSMDNLQFYKSYHKFWGWACVFKASVRKSMVPWD